MKGLTLRQIPAGKPGAGIKVVRLHYSADPTMTPDRISQLKSEYPDQSYWDREMEIDPNSRSGRRVFPEFNEEIHYVPQFLPLHPPSEWTVYRACDPHPRRAHSFVWLAVNKYGEMTIPWSWWPEEVNLARERGEMGQEKRHRLLIREYAEMLRDVEKANFFPPSFLDIMDSAGKNFNSDEKHNFFDAYRQEDIYWQPAKKNIEYAGYALINRVLAPTKYTIGNEERVTPLLTIMQGCGDNEKLVRQLKFLRWREWRGVVPDKDAPDTPEEKDRHLVDCLSYILLEMPELIGQGTPLPKFRPLYPAIGW